MFVYLDNILAICDRDTQCHYISIYMICTSIGIGAKKCYCSNKALRDLENGLCKQVSSVLSSVSVFWLELFSISSIFVKVFYELKQTFGRCQISYTSSRVRRGVLNSAVCYVLHILLPVCPSAHVLFSLEASFFIISNYFWINLSSIV